MSRSILVFLGAITLAGAATGCGDAIRASEGFRLLAAWEDYERLVVRTMNGRVAVATDGRDERAVITGTKYARGPTLDRARQYLAALSVVAGPDPADARTLRVLVKPPPPALRGGSLGASLEVHVPAACAVDVVSSNGSVRIVEVEGACAVTTSNAAVRAHAVRGNLNVVTCNGSITAEAEPPEDGQVRLETSNAGIHVVLPAALSGRLEARTSNGRVVLDSGAATLRMLRSSGSAARAVMNDGGAARVDLETCNGSVEVTWR